MLSTAGDAVRGMMVSHPDLFFELHVASVVRRAGGGAGGGAGGPGGGGGGGAAGAAAVGAGGV